MKIIFICGCIEPGKDGVGDYTRILCANSIKENNESVICAFNDKYVNDFSIEEQFYHNLKIKVFRFPHGISSQQKIVLLNEILNEFNPNWISIQLVSYSFNKKGLLWKESISFSKLLKRANIHLMLHELWIGFYNEASLKYKVVGFLQKVFLRRFIKKLKPELVTSSNQAFSYLLKFNKINNRILPLFPNINVKDELFKENQDTLFNKYFPLITNRKDYLILTFFGSINPEISIAPFIKYLSVIKNIKILIVSIGKIGQGQGVWNEMQNLANKNMSFVQLGQSSEEKISEILYLTDIGLSSYPYLLIEKSGSIAAFLAYKCPVIVLGNKETVKGFEIKENEGFYKNIFTLNSLKDRDISKLKFNNSEKMHYSQKEVSSLFLNFLKKVQTEKLKE